MTSRSGPAAGRPAARLSRIGWLRLLLLLVAAAPASGAPQWPQFRGPAGDGHSAAKALPLHWAEGSNVVWKTAIHDRGWSSPVIWGRQVWLTTATRDGRELFAVCVDAATGRIIHDLKLFDVAAPQFCHAFNSYASPTPVIESGRVYVTFGSPGTACLDTRTGRVLWERRDLECNHFRGAGSSPILHRDLLLLHFDGSDLQYLVALDKRTGRTVWKTDRALDHRDLGPDGKPELEGDYRKAFGTPHVAEIGGRPVLLSQGSKAAYAYDPRTGVELWRVEERTAYSASTRPVFGHGLVFFPTGWAQGQLLAVQPGRPGEVIDANAPPPETGGPGLRVAWKSRRNVPKKPSVLLVGDLLFTVDDGGIASCLEAKTGAEVWRERVGGNYSASPLAAPGRVYFFNEEGKATVIAAGRDFRVLAENRLADGFMASPAVTGDALILRTKSALYRIEPPPPPGVEPEPGVGAALLAGRLSPESNGAAGGRTGRPTPTRRGPTATAARGLPRAGRRSTGTPPSG